MEQTSSSPPSPISHNHHQDGKQFLKKCWFTKEKNNPAGWVHSIKLIRTGSNCLGSDVWRGLTSLTWSFITWLCDSIWQNSHYGPVWVRHYFWFHGGYEMTKTWSLVSESSETSSSLFVIGYEKTSKNSGPKIRQRCASGTRRMWEDAPVKPLP